MRRDRVSMWPVGDNLRGLDKESLRLDVQAGVTVAVFAVPQAMAYAILIGVPPVHGLYAAVVMSIVAALWGSSPHVNTGPTNSAAILTAAAIAPFAVHEQFLSIVFMFTLMVGIIRLVMGVLRLGELIDLVPESAFLGYIVGAGLLIALGQIHLLLGVEASHNPWFLLRLSEVLQHVDAASALPTAIGIGTFTMMLALDRFSQRYPVALGAVATATLAAWMLRNGQSVPTVHDIAPIQFGLPRPALPLLDLQVARVLLPGAVAVAVIGLIEAVSIGHTLALRHGRSLDFNQEFFGQGLSQVVGAFFQAIPGSGSFGRSLLIEQSGGRTCMANVVFGIAISTALLTIPRILNLIPVSALAGLLLYIGVKLVDVHRIQRVIATSPADTLVMILTFITTVFVRIEYGIFVGILSAAVIHLNRTRQLRLVELVPHDDTTFDEMAYDEAHHHSPSDLVVLGVSGELFYGVSHMLRDQLNSIVRLQRPKRIVVRLRRAYSVDYSCWSALFDFVEAFHAAGGKLYLCGVRRDYDRIIDQAGIRDLLPTRQVYPARESLFAAFQTCVNDVVEDLPADALLAPPWMRYRDLHAPKGLAGSET